MPTRFWRFSLLVLLFAGFYSCKKEGTPPGQNNQHTQNNQIDSCSTSQDCQAIGKYLVTESYNEWSPGYSYDTTYGIHYITVTEVGLDSLQFLDTMAFGAKFTVAYDSASSTTHKVTFDGVLYPSGFFEHLEVDFMNGDSISVTTTTDLGAAASNTDYWLGVKVH